MTIAINGPIEKIPKTSNIETKIDPNMIIINFIFCSLLNNLKIFLRINIMFIYKLSYKILKYQHFFYILIYQ